MPAIRTHSEDVPASVPIKAARPAPPTSRDRIATEQKKHMEATRKRQLVNSALPALASQTSTNEEKIKAAEELRQGVLGEAGMGNVVECHGTMGEIVDESMLQARRDHKSFLRYPTVLYEAIKMYGLAGKALVELNRPRKHGDGRRAFVLLKAFLLSMMDALIEFHEPGMKQWDIIYHGTFMCYKGPRLPKLEELQAVEAGYTPTALERATFAREKEELFHLLESTYDELFCAAIRKYKADVGPKRSLALSKQGYEWSLELAYRCNQLRDVCQYDVKPDVATSRRAREGSADSGYYGTEVMGMDKEIFAQSRNEPRDWYYMFKRLDKGKPDVYEGPL